MSFQTYQLGLKLATDAAQKAVSTEASLTRLGPAASPLPVLRAAFAQYVAAAEHYTRLLGSGLVPAAESAGVKTKLRLVLSRAEKVKARIAALGGQAGRVAVGDGEDELVVRRGGRVNGLDLPRWAEPADTEFAGGRWSTRKVETPRDAEVQWGEPEGSWAPSRRRCGGAPRPLYPQDANGLPRRSDNGKHIARLLINGVWRSAVIDSSLPSTPAGPLYITAQDALPGASTAGAASPAQTPPHLPLLSKAYLTALGGYDIAGSAPGDAVHALTGWIPERVGLRHGFQREKTWARVRAAWERGDVLLSLGTGRRRGATCAGGRRLVGLHAYAVLDLKDVGGERTLEILDPGATSVEDDVVALSIDDAAEATEGARVVQAQQQHRAEVFEMSWDEVCDAFDTLELNWDPKLRPVQVTRHWTWKAPPLQRDSAQSVPRFHLTATLPDGADDSDNEIWLLLSQHVVSKDRPIEDVALHVSVRAALGTTPGTDEPSTPYANAVHTLVRHRIRGREADLTVVPARDGGVHDVGFTLHAFAPAGSTLALERDVVSLPFSQSVSGELYASRAGGNHGHPTFHRNPQYKLSVAAAPTRGTEPGAATLRVALSGTGEASWNAKVVWGSGRQVFELTDGMVVLDSGAYAYGGAHGEAASVAPGTYTLIVSTFDPGQTGSFTLSVECSAPVTLAEIAPEGAGMFHRTMAGTWRGETAAGRPGLGSYERNPVIELTLPQPASVIARLHLPAPAPAPLNLSLFARAPGGAPGTLAATSGPYSAALAGAALPRTRADAGIYLLVPSTYAPWAGGWVLDVWADAKFEIERTR